MVCVGDPNANGWLAGYGTTQFTVRESTFQSGTETLPARLYTPVGVPRPPAIVIVPGVHHLGIDEPRLKNFASAMARHGITVYTPAVPDIFDYRVTPRSVEIVGAAIHALRQETGAEKVGVLGLSFAGGLSLLAAADPQHAEETAFVAAIGAHDDLTRVLRFFAKNQIESPDHTFQAMQAHEYGPLVAVYSHPEAFFSAADLEPARTTIRYLLWEEIDRSHLESAKLSADGRQRMKLLFEHRTDTLAPIILANIDRYSDEMAPVSPHGRLSGVKAPVFLLHGAPDNVIPPSETLWLQADLPPGTVRNCLISPVISHVELGGKPKLRDNLLLVHWMEQLLAEAQSSARPSR